MHIGIPIMKCSLHPSTQVNSKTGKAAKTCGVGSAWREMNDERLGRDTTIDRDMTHLNVWMEGNTLDDVESIVQEKISEINDDRKQHNLRSLRNDAVSVAEIVEKPNIEIMRNLSYEDRVKLLNDSHEVMKKLIHDWNPNWQIIEAVQHHDEFGGLSAHNHELVLLSSKDKNGVATMQAKNELNLKFFNYINSNYPAQMRQRGYEIDDIKTYDRLSDEEKEERRLRPKEHGVDAYTYKQKKQEEMNQQLKETQEKLETTKQEIGNLHKEKEDLIDAKNNLNEIKEIYKARVETLGQLIDNPEQAKQVVELAEENKSLKEELSFKDKVIQGLKEETEKLTNTINDFKSKLSRLGEKLMRSIGFEPFEKTSQFPNKEVSKAIASLQDQTKQYNPKDMRVIEDENGFKVVVKDGSGYKTLEDGFNDRQQADEYRRGYDQTRKELVPNKEQDESLKLK